MEFLQITSPEDYRVQEIYRSYCNTFPEDERRDWEKLITLFSNPKAKIISVLHDSKNIGYLILWELSNYTFVEHFEVFEEFRSQKLGSHITQYLFENFPRIILEIEPDHLNENAARRYAFYQRNGFRLIDEMYVQPSYGKGKKPLNLWLLSNYTPENLNNVKDEIYDIVYH
ncbi:GNAT family N-acetyltransferase [Chryseobacterium shandongense]|uniref:GNAT family N-acetyltransferase n=1 Tax=Chryseobacterium shandongense TaxID=1493872 RepID=A0A3G6R0R2_9FLAO|nr:MULTISPECIES: GNAT family N-acetyltransferase [Chryseobacterium]AZA58917.1 GNAT family N-acetyltransferase [Chryseobacterium shandongense]AZA87016.1 GNAT family N-acetyltransferase [Chryseobacterium shandongense]AZA95445.1 GNAT family N-acetyltransferase [Chryseobacterium shandongense]